MLLFDAHICGSQLMLAVDNKFFWGNFVRSPTSFIHAGCFVNTSATKAGEQKKQTQKGGNTEKKKAATKKSPLS
jgi:hypothetical protein